MPKIIAFEGNLSSDLVISWGAAAIDDGNNGLLNTVTGRSVDISRFTTLLESENLTKIEKPIELNTSDLENPIYVLAINLDQKHGRRLLVETNKLASLIDSKRTKDWQFYIFSSLNGLDQYANRTITVLLNQVLYEEIQDNEKRELLDIGTILNSSNPHLNAIKLIVNGSNEFDEKLSRANIRNEKDIEIFDEILSANKNLEDIYELKYEEGVAKGGGIDVGIAANTFANLNEIHKKIRPQLLNRHRYLEKDYPSPRLKQLEAASADLRFSAVIDGAPLGERLARVLELQQMERILRGEIPNELAGNVEFELAIEKVISPSLETRVTQKPLGKVDLEPVFIERELGSDVKKTDVISVLGFQSGISDKARRIEIMLSPKYRILVSTFDNGFGAIPKGIDFIHSESDFLFKPAVFSIIRAQDSQDRHKYYLFSMSTLNKGEEQKITAIPSSILYGAFLTKIDLPVYLTAKNSLNLGGEDINLGKSPRSIDQALSWINNCSKIYLEYELKYGSLSKARWIKPVKSSEPNSMSRVLIALNRLNNEATVTKVMEVINKEFDTNVRRNNTRREVLRHPELLEFNSDNDQIIRMTDRGMRYIAAYLSASGYKLQK